MGDRKIRLEGRYGFRNVWVAYASGRFYASQVKSFIGALVKTRHACLRGRSTAFSKAAN